MGLCFLMIDAWMQLHLGIMTRKGKPSLAILQLIAQLAKVWPLIVLNA